MFDNVLADLVAAGSVAADGSSVNCRGAAPATTGTGVYTVTLDRLADATESLVLVTPRTTADIAASVVHTSATVKTINFKTITTGGGVAANCAFDFAVIRLQAGTGR